MRVVLGAQAPHSEAYLEPVLSGLVFPAVSRLHFPLSGDGFRLVAIGAVEPARIVGNFKLLHAIGLSPGRAEQGPTRPGKPIIADAGPGSLIRVKVQCCGLPADVQ